VPFISFHLTGERCATRSPDSSPAERNDKSSTGAVFGNGLSLHNPLQDYILTLVHQHRCDSLLSSLGACAMVPAWLVARRLDR
jgi:hypothetical protein